MGNFERLVLRLHDLTHNPFLSGPEAARQFASSSDLDMSETRQQGTASSYQHQDCFPQSRDIQSIVIPPLLP